QQDRLGDGDAKRLCRSKIDDQLKLGRLLDRQVARFGALQDLDDIAGRSTEQIAEIRPIGHECACVGEVPHPEYHWEPGLRRQLEERRSMSSEEGILDHVQRLGLCPADSREGWTELLSRSHTEELELDRQRGRRRLEFLDHLQVVWRGWIPEDCDPG